MFDWNDEELGSIIWDEAGEDHIVPHPDRNKDDCSKKDQKGEVSATKASAQKTLEVNHGYFDLKLKSTSNYGKHGKSSSSGLGMDSWLDMDFVKTDQEFKNCEVADNVPEKETSDPDRDYQLFENPQGEEHNDFLGYGWENIGSFDDLDRFFGNEDPFGNILGNADELWSSKHVTDSSIRSFSHSGSPSSCSETLTDTPEILQVNSKIAHEDDPSFKLNSSQMQARTNEYSISRKYSAEEIVLSRLQDVIAKLDSRIRLCIRDSLFRLAKSAVQRRCTGDNRSTSTTRVRDEEIVDKEDTESNSREVKMLDGETKTNPIDRVVAHLLFHRPLDSTINHFSTPPSPIYSKLPPPENNIASSSGNLSSRALPEGSIEAEPCISYQGPKIPSLCKNADFVKTSTSEGTSYSGTMEIEASTFYSKAK